MNTYSKLLGQFSQPDADTASGAQRALAPATQARVPVAANPAPFAAKTAQAPPAKK